MTQEDKKLLYIDKAVVVAEIERLISNGQVKLQESQESNDYESNVAWSEHIATCRKVLSFINTLEVKEVDLEKEIEKYLLTNATFLIGGDSKLVVHHIAKHFFELGLKIQKGE